MVAWVELQMATGNPWLSALALLCIGVAAWILLHTLWRRPALDVPTKVRLFLGLGIFPGLAAVSSTVVGMQSTTERNFCGSCHVMSAHLTDTADPESQSLAARHSRNPFFGDRSCYVCHADYGMYGYALTKAAGLGHVYRYYFEGYSSMPLEQAKREIHLAQPYRNENCRQCHTTSLEDWRRVPDHEALKTELFQNKVSCASAGCHGYAHPFTKNRAPTKGTP